MCSDEDGGRLLVFSVVRDGHSLPNKYKMNFIHLRFGRRKDSYRIYVNVCGICARMNSVGTRPSPSLYYLHVYVIIGRVVEPATFSVADVSCRWTLYAERIFRTSESGAKYFFMLDITLNIRCTLPGDLMV